MLISMRVSREEAKFDEGQTNGMGHDERPKLFLEINGKGTEGILGDRSPWDSHFAKLITRHGYLQLGYTIKVPLTLVDGILLLKFHLPAVKYRLGLRTLETSLLGIDQGIEDHP